MHDKRWEHWEKINLVDNEKNDKELHKEVQGKSNLPASPPQKTQIVTQYSAAQLRRALGCALMLSANLVSYLERSAFWGFSPKVQPHPIRFCLLSLCNQYCKCAKMKQRIGDGINKIETTNYSWRLYEVGLISHDAYFNIPYYRNVSQTLLYYFITVLGIVLKIFLKKKKKKKEDNTKTSNHFILAVKK